ncbi:hypothetical protein L6452_33345 [Arctium lappa]|uniref:Uncharacterized protein n=1 Tax=Arctium lappa TaxID=4217 RepID=A0ACB8YF86_ARCLA|nr:hypothetical protein L6452_33345 [Arctium lappa]
MIDLQQQQHNHLLFISFIFSLTPSHQKEKEYLNSIPSSSLPFSDLHPNFTSLQFNSIQFKPRQRLKLS